LLPVTVLGSASVAFVDQSPLHPQGPVANHINDVFWPLFWVSVVVTAGVSLAILYSAVRFRRKHDDEEPVQTHGNNKLELGWTIIPFVILVSLFALTAANMNVIASTPSGAMAIKVTGVRFYWQFDYGVKKANGKELTTIKDFYVPVGTPVALEIHSTDVNHSLFLPHINGQMNAIPGQINHTWMQIDKAGDYMGACTELCGDGHWLMDFTVHALSKADFDAWMSKQTGSSASTAGAGAGGQ
jgi:cytochrome c oxidase subunit 2